MPLSKAVYLGTDVNIWFRGRTKDGRAIYEQIDKATGKKKRLVVSKRTYEAMNRIMQEPWVGKVMENLAKK